MDRARSVSQLGANFDPFKEPIPNLMEMNGAWHWKLELQHFQHFYREIEDSQY
jgi:hypothetical protein